MVSLRSFERGLAKRSTAELETIQETVLSLFSELEVISRDEIDAFRDRIEELARSVTLEIARRA
jgi:polyhydroxyalkanoate synthesis regulator phasin